MDQMQSLLSIGFKFNKGIEDKIYKQEICMQHNIDLKINDKIIERISKIELISKINFLEANNLNAFIGMLHYKAMGSFNLTDEGKEQYNLYCMMYNDEDKDDKQIDIDEFIEKYTY